MEIPFQATPAERRFARPLSTTQPKPPGRPRSEAARQAILTAAYQLLKESPLSAITSALLADRAGVSKATLYRWWPSKEAILLDGYFETISHAIEQEPSGDPLSDLTASVQRGYATMSGPDGEIFADLVAASRFDGDMQKALNEQLNGPRCQETVQILQAAIDAGQVEPVDDPDLLIEMIYGPLFSRLMTGEEIEPDLADRILEKLVPRRA